MATRKGQFNKSSGKEASSGGGPKSYSGKEEYQFVDRALSETDKDQLRSLVENGEFDIVRLSDFIDESGAKVSVASDKQGKGFLATASCSDKGNANYGLIVTSRGRSAAHAITGLLYRCLVLADDGLWATLIDASSDLPDYS